MQNNTHSKKYVNALQRFKKRVREREEPGAVVVGLDTNGLGVVRSLGRKGIPVLGIDSTFSQPAASTKYCEKINCPDMNSPVLVDTLKAIVSEIDVKPVLFLSGDLSVMLVSEMREKLQPHYRFLLPEKDMVAMLMNKKLFGLYALENKLPVPATFFANSEKEIREVADTINYPCIIKPVFRNRRWQGSVMQKTFKLISKRELVDTYSCISTLQEDVIVQEWIPGPDSYIYFCLLYFDGLSKPAAQFVGRKLLQWLPGSGSTAIAEDIECDSVLEESIRLFQSIGFKGLGSVEFKRDPRDGRFKITEPTVGRTNLQSGIASACGVDIPYIVYCDLTGKIPLNGNAGKIKRSKWIYEQNVLNLVLHRKEYGLTLNAIISLFRGNRSYALFAWDDSIPFIKFMETVAKRGGTHRWFTRKK